MSNSQNWDGSSYGNRLGYKIFEIALSLFGTRFAYFLLIFVASYYCLFRPKSTASSRAFKEVYNNWSGRQKTLGAFFAFARVYCFGQALVDRLYVLLLQKHKFSLIQDGAENLLQIKESGGILLGAHIGNWEVGLSLLKSVRNIDTSVAMMTISEDFFQQQLRQKLGSGAIIPVKENVHTLTVRRHLQERKIVVYHGDRYLGNPRTMEIDFMGRPAKFPVGPYIIAATLEKPICFVSVIKRNAKTYKLICSEPKKYRWDRKTKKDQQLRSWLEEYVRFIERQVSEAPTQWYNFYDFWAS